jgi:hypothetical protein
MTDMITSAIVGGIAGIITGSLSSLFAPWIHWGIEKRRGIRKDRTLLLNNTQAMIVDYRSGIGVDEFLPIGSSLYKNIHWIRIKPYLSIPVLKQMEDIELEPPHHKKVHEALDTLEIELSRLRKKWHLV